VLPEKDCLQWRSSARCCYSLTRCIQVDIARSGTEVVLEELAWSISAKPLDFFFLEIRSFCTCLEIIRLVHVNIFSGAFTVVVQSVATSESRGPAASWLQAPGRFLLLFGARRRSSIPEVDILASQPRQLNLWAES
jgi:hypothetical protein